MEKNTVTLSANAIAQIKLWREYKNAGVNISDLIVDVLERISIYIVSNPEETEEFLDMFKSFIFYRDILNSLLEEGGNE